MVQPRVGLSFLEFFGRPPRPQSETKGRGIFPINHPSGQILKFSEKNIFFTRGVIKTHYIYIFIGHLNTRVHMRRTGRTTRTVDAAVQALFKHGKIIMPIGRDYSDEWIWKQTIASLDPEQVIIDADALLVVGMNNEHTNEVQRHLCSRVYRRLWEEHLHLFENKVLDFHGPDKNLIEFKPQSWRDFINEKVYEYNPNNGLKREDIENALDILSLRTERNENKFQAWVFGTPGQVKKVQEDFDKALKKHLKELKKK
jgi:hypothetical protein